MSRAFLYAGADSVLISLWNVNDASTAELMKLVYRNLSKGLSRDDALRAAKLQVVRGPQRPAFPDRADIHLWGQIGGAADLDLYLGRLSS